MLRVQSVVLCSVVDAGVIASMMKFSIGDSFRVFDIECILLQSWMGRVLEMVLSSISVSVQAGPTIEEVRESLKARETQGAVL